MAKLRPFAENHKGSATTENSMMLLSIHNRRWTMSDRRKRMAYWWVCLLFTVKMLQLLI